MVAQVPCSCDCEVPSWLCPDSWVSGLFCSHLTSEILSLCPHPFNTAIGVSQDSLTPSPNFPKFSMVTSLFCPCLYLPIGD